MYNHNFTWGFHLLINKLLKTSHSDQFTKHYLISFYFENEMSISIDGQLIFLSSIRLNFLNNVWGNTDWNWSSIGQRSDISLTSGIGILLLLDTSFNISNGSKILYYDAQMFEFVHHSFGGIRLQINKDRNMCVISSSDLFCYVVHRVLKVWLYEIIIFIQLALEKSLFYNSFFMEISFLK